MTSIYGHCSRQSLVLWWTHWLSYAGCSFSFGPEDGQLGLTPGWSSVAFPQCLLCLPPAFHPSSLRSLLVPTSHIPRYQGGFRQQWIEPWPR